MPLWCSISREPGASVVIIPVIGLGARPDDPGGVGFELDTYCMAGDACALGPYEE